MENNDYHLGEILDHVKGPTPEQLSFYNQWAAVALDNFHENCEAEFTFLIDGTEFYKKITWDSNFSKAAMKERKDMAHFGGISMAFFVMSVLLDFTFIGQSEIGDGVDYYFQKEEPDPYNFFADSHFVEISGLLEERGSNKLSKRLDDKHGQIDRGAKRDFVSSVIVTLFEKPVTVKEKHHESK